MKQGRILLVDDDRLVLSTLGSGLREMGYTIFVADSCEKALEIAEKETLDLAILDIHMPGMSGVELSSNLRDQHGTPILFLTAYTDDATVEQAVTSGGIGYQVKPVDVPQLTPAIESALARGRDFQALEKNQTELAKALENSRYTSIGVGILIERQGLTEKEAFETLRRHARSRQERVADVARGMIAAADTLNSVYNTRKN